jgi:hypothetical protein
MTDATLGIKFGKVRAASAQHPVDVNPDTWTKHIPMKLMSIPEAITRGDLVAEGERVDWDNDDDVRRLFVLTMAWGSGKTNGRGPRNTAAALATDGATDTLRLARTHLSAGEIPAAYDLYRQLRGIGPSFHTKWIWLVGRLVGTVPRPLILDARVWCSLRALKWNSLEAAGGDRRYSHRYVAYLQACQQWAGTKHSAEDVEFTLFDRNGSTE